MEHLYIVCRSGMSPDGGEWHRVRATSAREAARIALEALGLPADDAGVAAYIARVFRESGAAKFIR